MDGVLYWASLVFVIVVCLFVVIRLYLLHTFIRLRLFAVNWRTIDECVEYGLNKFICSAILEALYGRNLVVVRPRKMTATDLGINLDEVNEKGETVYPDETTQDFVNQIIERYDRTLADLPFNGENIDFFEFRIVQRGKKRRRWHSFLRGPVQEISH